MRDYPWQPKELRTHTNQCNNCHHSPALTDPLPTETIEQQRLAGVLANYAWRCVVTPGIFDEADAGFHWASSGYKQHSPSSCYAPFGVGRIRRLLDRLDAIE